MAAPPSIVAFATRVLGAVFGRASWASWLVVLKAIFGVPLTAAELVVFTRLTHRPIAPPVRIREAWFIVGRRAGKTMIAALIVVFCCTCRSVTLAPGEVGVFMVIAADRRQARVCKSYISGLLHSVAPLRALVAGETAEAIDLTTGIRIEIHTASFRTVRGYTVIGAVCDELAFWRSETSANPDREILAALRPAMATIDGALLVVLSSPYARRGELWRTYRQHFGAVDSSTLVAQADTPALNPTIDPTVLAQAYADDPIAAATEYGAEFRRDIEAFVADEILTAAMAAQPGERPFVAGTRYHGFTDPSGGSVDAMTLAIAHVEGDRVVLDVVREVRPPFSPEQAVTDFAAVLTAYGITTVVGDRYAGAWPREQFLKHGLTYEPADRPKTEYYRELLPLLNSGRVDLLHVARLRVQLGALERTVSRGGRDVIDHAPGGADDAANSVAGACVLAHERDGRSAMPEDERLRCLRAGGKDDGDASVDEDEGGLFRGDPDAGPRGPREDRSWERF